MKLFKLSLLGLLFASRFCSAADFALKLDDSGLTITQAGAQPQHLVGEGMKALDLSSGGTARVTVVASPTGYRCLEVLTTGAVQFDALAQTISLESGGSFRATIVDQGGRPNLDVNWDGASVVANAEKIDADAILRFFTLSKSTPAVVSKVNADQPLSNWPAVKSLKEARDALHTPNPPKGDDAVTLSLSEIDSAPAAKAEKPVEPAVSPSVLPAPAPSTPKPKPVAAATVPAPIARSTPPPAPATPVSTAPPTPAPPTPATPTPKPLPTANPIPTPPPKILAMKPGDSRVPPGYSVERIGEGGPTAKVDAPQETPLPLSVIRLDYPAASNPPQGIQILGSKPRATPPPATPEPKKKKKISQ